VIIWPATLSPSIINTAVSSALRSRAKQLGHRCFGGRLEPARHRRARHRLAVHRPDGFGDVDVAAGSHPGQHPLHHDLAQQVLGGEALPRRQLDLAAVDEAASRPGHGHLLRAQHDLTSRRAMPVPDPPDAEAGVLRADDGGELLGEHLLHHHQPRGGRKRQQTFSHRGGDVGHRHRGFQRQGRPARRRHQGS